MEQHYPTQAIQPVGERFYEGMSPLPNHSPYQPGVQFHPGSADLSNNFLVQAATPLLTLITQIKHITEHPNVPVLRSQVIEEIKKFERKLAQVEYPIRTIVAARYCLCTAIDEAVLGCPWGIQSLWVKESLLSLFHKQTWGGEQFYVVLEHMMRDVRGNIDFIELVYNLMSLGFEGKFHGDQNKLAREEIRSRIFYHIRHSRAKPERALSSYWRVEKLPVGNQARKAKIKKVSIYTVSVLLVIGVFFNYITHRAAGKTLQRLDGIATVSPVTTFSQVVPRQIVIRDDVN